MKKAIFMIMAVLAVFGMVSCGGGGGGNNPPPEDLVDTEVFNMSTDATFQALTPGAITDWDTNPIPPFIRAGKTVGEIVEEDDVNVLVISNPTSNGETWGPGIDLRHAAATDAQVPGFGFRAGDVIVIEGEVTSADGSEVRLLTRTTSTGSVEMEKFTKDTTNEGILEWTITLTAADITNIVAGDPKGIRISLKQDTVFKITNITINGKRPSNIVALAAPVISLDSTDDTGRTIKWTAVTGAGGYKVSVAPATGEAIVSTLESTVTSVNVYTVLKTAEADDGTYKITVIALGVSGTSSNSPASNELSFTLVTPYTLKTTYETTVTAVKGFIGANVSGKVAANAFQINLETGGYGNTYTSFGVTFSDAEKVDGSTDALKEIGYTDLTDFDSVTFHYDYIVTGDGDNGTYKTFYLLASTSAKTGYISNPGDTPTDVIGTVETGSVTSGTGKDLTFVLDAEKMAALAEEDTVFFTIVPWSGAYIYNISDIKFVKNGETQIDELGITFTTVQTAEGVGSFKITAQPTTDSYTAGDTFDPTGMKVTPTMSTFEGNTAGTEVQDTGFAAANYKINDNQYNSSADTLDMSTANPAKKLYVHLTGSNAASQEFTIEITSN